MPSKHSLTWDLNIFRYFTWLCQHQLPVQALPAKMATLLKMVLFKHSWTSIAQQAEGQTAHLDSDSFPIVHTPEDTALVRLDDELAQFYPIQCARRLHTVHTAQALCNSEACA